MSASTINKILIAIVFAVAVAYFSGFISKALIKVEMPKEPVYAIAPEPEEEIVAENTSGVAVEVVEELPQDLGSLLAAADASKGKKIFKACAACHTVDQGGANRVGPNLWNIVGRNIATAPGFGYSDAMKEHGREAGTWSYEMLDAYLTKPKAVVPGTRMAYGGMKNAAKRAALLAYLSSMSTDPVAFPDATAAE